jgi:ribosomal protein L29
MEEELRTELMSLRVAQQVGGQPGKVNRIKMIRKAIARVLTVQTAKRRGEAYTEVSFLPYLIEIKDVSALKVRLHCIILQVGCLKYPWRVLNRWRRKSTSRSMPVTIATGLRSNHRIV